MVYVFHYDSEHGWTEGFPENPPADEPPIFDENDKRALRKFSITIAVTILIIIFIGILYACDIIPQKQYSDADFHIETYHSSVDQDSDGLDDQTDILQSARTYLSTSPKYQSKYYATGYPDDGYGVCTDVIAQALKGAGYDLRELVDRDIRENPQYYNIDTPDKNIDFRRVQNLEVHFRRHAQSLSTNLNDIYEWQGGDIVIFDGHIGLVSDRRNRKGIPYLIHHYGPFQLSYEEDVLSKYQILGHYRIS